MKMKITVTLREILHNGDWDAFCKDTGTSEWCLNEGVVDGDCEVTLTLEQAKKFKLIKDNA